MMLRRSLVRAVARAKPVIPDAAWPLLTTLRSAVTEGPLLAAPAFDRVLVLAAHPDDESAGCGGAMALLADSGCEVHVLAATRGEATAGADLPTDEVAQHRVLELGHACEVLGARPPRVLAHADGALAAAVGALAGDLEAAIDDIRPQAIFLPWFLDGHPDHRAVAAALGRVTVGADVELWGYETWTPLPANRLVDITGVLERKSQALACHVTAQLAFDISSILGINRFRSAQRSLGRGYVEGFLVAPAPEWFALARRARDLQP